MLRHATQHAGFRLHKVEQGRTGLSDNAESALAVGLMALMLWFDGWQDDDVAVIGNLMMEIMSLSSHTVASRQLQHELHGMSCLLIGRSMHLGTCGGLFHLSTGWCLAYQP
jgi:hypothetical protein